MRKRGAIEIQFNWILILVAGAAIIAIFIGFISKQQGISAVSTNILIASSLDAVLHGYEGTDISDAIEMPKSKVSFNCGSFSVDGISRQIWQLSLFSPAALETDKLLLLSFGWDMPYRIANFVYLTSPDARYIFIGNSYFARKMFEKMRGKARIDGFTNVQAIEDENDVAVRIIFFGQSPEIPESLKSSAITSLMVDGDENSGIIEFFDLVDGKFEPRGKSYYFGEASLFGAVFSENIGMYTCNMEKAFNKLKIISRIYNKKVNNIIKQYNSTEQNNVCNIFYQSNSDKILGSISYLSSLDFQSSNYEDIIKAADEIKKANSGADALSCILVY